MVVADQAEESASGEDRRSVAGKSSTPLALVSSADMRFISDRKSIPTNFEDSLAFTNPKIFSKLQGPAATLCGCVDLPDKPYNPTTSPLSPPSELDVNLSK
jgi:hypothetical protein